MEGYALHMLLTALIALVMHNFLPWHLPVQLYALLGWLILLKFKKRR